MSTSTHEDDDMRCINVRKDRVFSEAKNREGNFRQMRVLKKVISSVLVANKKKKILYTPIYTEISDVLFNVT